MERLEIIERMKKFDYWYHRIELAPGVITPGFALEPLWENLRKVRSRVDYTGKSVLDIASFDGMFAFEAERLGADLVVATDCLYKSFKNFLFCRDIFESDCLPFFNVSPYNLVDRLDVFMDENYETGYPDQRKFDIVQHFGLLYHLRDPMYSLAQARSVLKPGGRLIIETDMVLNQAGSFMAFNGLPTTARIRDNYSVWWAPTRTCLFEMLQASMFDVLEDTFDEIVFDVPAAAAGRISNDGGTISTDNMTIGRGAVVAVAREPDGKYEKLQRELRRSYRNPGFAIHRLGWNEETVETTRVLTRTSQ